jgi:hypothetical protein
MTLFLAATATALTSMALISWALISWLQPACERWAQRHHLSNPKEHWWL